MDEIYYADPDKGADDQSSQELRVDNDRHGRQSSHLSTARTRSQLKIMFVRNLVSSYSFCFIVNGYGVADL